MQKSTRAVQEISDTESDFENIDLSDIVEESDKSVSNDSKQKYVPEGQKIRFANKIIISENEYKSLKTITKEKFNKLDFNKFPFIEQLIHHKDQPLYVHLFFDIDDMKSTTEYEEFIKWLDSLKPVFGEYSIGGYCNNEEMAAFGYKLIATATKYVSLHVAFYQTAIDADEIHLIGKKSTKNMWSKIDESIYTIQNPTKKDTQKQGMRFVLSNKVYGDPKGEKKDEKTAGYILNERLPHTCTYQVWGGERIVSREEWSKIFTIAEEEKPKRNIRKTRKALVANEVEKPELFAEKEYVIPVDEEVVLELLNEFEPTHAQLERIGCSLMQSPFDKETVEELLKDWYFQKGTDHHHFDTVDAYLNKYYKREYTNRWLFSIIKKIPDAAERDKWYNEFNNKGIDPDVQINLQDDFTLENIRNTDYTRVDGKGIDAMRFMNDLKKCAILFGTGKKLVAVKSYNELKKTNSLEVMNKGQFYEELRDINIGRYYKNGKLKDCTAYMVFACGKNKQCISYNGMRFYDTDPKIFTYFRGYDYKELDDYNEDVISFYLNHIRENIANGNEELYNYILNWISFILQNPEGKTGSCLVITGEQGTGKNTFTDVICDLMNRYAVRNLTDISQLVGKFNAVVENSKLIVCNEMASADANFHLDVNSLKTIITDKEIGVEDKFEQKRYVQNVVNLIVLSNNFDPVKVEKDDRRYVVCNTNTVHKDDQDYFEKLRNAFTEEFYQNLFTFFMKRNLEGVNLRTLPNTEAKQELMEANKSVIEYFIQDFIVDFTKGFAVEDTYEYYVKWISKYGSNEDKKKASKPEMGKKLTPFCVKNAKRIKGRGTKNVYYLKKEKMKYFDLAKYESVDDIENDTASEDNNSGEEGEQTACEKEEVIACEYTEKYEDFKNEIFRIKA